MSCWYQQSVSDFIWGFKLQEVFGNLWRTVDESQKKWWRCSLWGNIDHKDDFPSECVEADGSSLAVLRLKLVNCLSHVWSEKSFTSWQICHYSELLSLYPQVSTGKAQVSAKWQQHESKLLRNRSAEHSCLHWWTMKIVVLSNFGFNQKSDSLGNRLASHFCLQSWSCSPASTVQLILSEYSVNPITIAAEQSKQDRIWFVEYSDFWCCMTQWTDLAIFLAFCCPTYPWLFCKYWVTLVSIDWWSADSGMSVYTKW